MSSSLQRIDFPPFPWSEQEIQRSLPHRNPFLLLSKIDEVSIWQHCFAWNYVSMDDPVFAGHFPEHPVYPGVMVLESLAQASGVMVQYSQGRPLDTCYLARVNNGRFLKPVLPGDEVRLEVKFLKKRPPFFWSYGEASVGDALVVQVDMTAYVTYC